ncbi:MULTISPECIES: hypothetical protein [unclassified Streptomyces]|uniref:hypothetical protein n=1 Tax=unclassified Streptomyces TaxID=2593676 RepID=UPI003249530A
MSRSAFGCEGLARCARQAEFRDLLSTPPPPVVAEVLAERRRKLPPPPPGSPTWNADLDRHGQLGRALPDLCDSYGPLHCNRLLGPSHPAERAAVELFHRTRQSLTLRAG